MRFCNLLAALRIWREIERTRPSVVHVFSGEGYPWTLMWAKKAEACGLPLLVTVHDPEPHPCNIWEWLNARCRSYVIKRATSVHVHSRVFIEAVKAQGARDICVIPHGSIGPRFLAYAKSDVRREPVALFFGRLEAYKGLQTLIEAGILLNGKLRIIIAGPGKLPKKLLNTIEEHRENFELYNYYLSDQEVAKLFQRASVCVLPYDHASQSSVPLIAAAFGVPVVATSVGAFVEDIPMVNGLLVPPKNPKALAQAMIEALNRAPIYPSQLEFSNIAKDFVQWYKRHARSCGC